MRNSFIVHIDSLCVLDDLTNEQRGELFYAIYCFQTGKEIELSPLVKIAFSQFKNQFIRDDEKYQNVVELRKQAGSKGGKQRLANQANATFAKQNQANQADSVSKSKNKSVSKSVSDSNSNSDNKILDIDSPRTNIVQTPHEEIVSYLNLKADTNYKSTTESTRKHIKARLNEGFTLEDFKTVIDKKVMLWKNDFRMNAYLRPETLFGTKFESYLNEVVSDSKILVANRTISENTAKTIDALKEWIND